MSDWPGFDVPVPDVILGPRAAGGIWPAYANAPAASAAWPSANLALYFPFRVSRPRTVVKLLCFNGATASGNLDMGIYDVAGTKLVSIGSTAQSGTTVIQEFDVTDTLLGAGLFYLAIAKDDTTGTLMRAGTGNVWLRTAGVWQQATAFPLPATATFAACAQSYFPGIAATTRSVV